MILAALSVPRSRALRYGARATAGPSTDVPRQTVQIALTVSLLRVQHPWDAVELVAVHLAISERVVTMNDAQHGALPAGALWSLQRCRSA